MDQEREVLNPLALRIWHGVHGVGILLLILTGIQLRFPDIFDLFGTLKRAIDLHNLIGFILLADYIVWFVYYAARRELIRQYLPTLRDLLEGTSHQASYYFYRMFLGDPAPFEPTAKEKFNSLQKVTYFAVMLFLLPLQILTGILLWNIEKFLPLIAAVGGVRLVDTFHVILAYIFAAFLLMHIYLATLGHTFFSHFKAIILGYEK
jgi:thiosulfate reductase cytochrome b subunit